MDSALSDKDTLTTWILCLGLIRDGLRSVTIPVLREKGEENEEKFRTEKHIGGFHLPFWFKFLFVLAKSILQKKRGG